MVFVNYYSRIRNTLHGNYDEMIAKDKGRIVTKEIEASNWSTSAKVYYKHRAGKLVRKIAEFNHKHGDEYDTLYQEFRIPKRTGGYRILHAPHEPLKSLQREVLSFLTKDSRLLPHNASHSFVKHRNCKTAMEAHQATGARWFLKIDIKDFFDSCTFEYALDMCRAMHPLSLLHKNTLEQILSICFFRNRLPQGAPTSPIISNIYLQFFDYMLTKQLRGFTYTRYADDILISKTTEFDWQDVVRQVQIILPPDLNIKPNKTRYGSSNGSNWNLGLMYNKDLNITVGYRNKHLLKNKIHNLFTNKPDEGTPEFVGWLESLYSLRGLLSYYKFIEPEYFTRLEEKYRALGYDL